MTLRPSYTLTFVALAALAVMTGCASAATEDEASGGDAITHEAAAAQNALRELVLQDAPASAENVEKLGITHWHVYVSKDDTFDGVVAFASDSQRDVRYALVVDPGNGTATVVAYDEYGRNDAAGPIPMATLQALLVDFGRLRDTLRAQSDREGATSMHTQALGAGARCALRFSAMALGLVAGTLLSGAVLASAVGVSVVASAAIGAAGCTVMAGTLTAVAVNVKKTFAVCDETTKKRK